MNGALRIWQVRLHCGDKTLPYDMSLLTARQFLWKQGGDMMLTYSEAKAGPPPHQFGA